MKKYFNLIICLWFLVGATAHAFPPMIGGGGATGAGTGDVLAGTMGTTGQLCTKNAATNTIDCNTSTLSNVTFGGFGTSKPTCSNSSGNLTDCTNLTDVAVPDKAAYTDINTGSDDAKFATPAALKASYVATKDVGWAIIDSDTVTAVADGKKAYVVPASLNGMNVVGFTCTVYNLNSASGGATTAQLRRSRAGTDADVLSSALSIAYTAYTANGTINTSYDDLATGDLLFVDIDSVTTGAAQKGFACTMTARLP